MLYDVEQVASKLNVSKQAIYNKLKLNDFKDRVLTKQGKSWIDDDLLNLIKDSLKVKSNLKDNSKPKNAEDVPPEELTLDDDLLNLNKELIDALLDQLKEKDSQIQSLHKLIENNQVLLKQPQQNILQIQEHFQTLDIKLTELREQMDHRRDIATEKSKKSWLDKILKK